MLREFKEFIMRGNVMDLAIGIIIGGAFGQIVTSLVNDIITPPLGLLLGGANFTDMFISLSGGSYPTLAAAKEAGAPTINYGVFVGAVINFLIVGTAIYMIVRAVNQVRGEKPAPAAPTTKDCPYCCSTIPIGATRCAHCTSELAVLAPA